MNRIKELRQQNELTLLQLAKKLNVSESTAQRYETGHIKKLKYETMELLGNIFNCSPAYLMGWSNERSGNDTNQPAFEQQLLKVVRNLNQEGQEMILKQAEALEASGLYNISDQDRVFEKNA